MNITDKNIDGGKAFDFGRTSKDYARYRDIYPQIFYDHILRRGLCRSGQRVLDLGTGTGVLPRNMARYGARWTGTAISENQIEQAKILSQGMNIDYLVSPAEAINFPAGTFDGITACQCFWYFDHARMAPLLSDMLKPGGYWFIKMNPYYSKEELESFEYKNAGNNIYEKDHIMRLRQATTNYWKEKFARFGKEIIYLEFEYPWQEGMNRLFVYQS